jgi:hypothetical protein
MARSDTRYSIYPAPKAVEVIGISSPALNQAIECWAALLARAIADNAKSFWSDAEIYDVYHLNPWGLLVDVLKEVKIDPEFPNPAELLATAVEDAQRLEDIGLNWFTCGFDGEQYSKAFEGEFRRLVQELRGLDYVHAWAVIVEVQWFMEHRDEGVDVRNDHWWTLGFRRTWKEKQARKHGSREPKDRQRATGAGKRKRAVTSKRAGSESQ